MLLRIIARRHWLPWHCQPTALPASSFVQYADMSGVPFVRPTSVHVGEMPWA